MIIAHLVFPGQPRSQGSLLPFPTERERERRVGERTWERGCSQVSLQLPSVFSKIIPRAYFRNFIN